jgi:Fe-S cluster assembly ATPase SufC
MLEITNLHASVGGKAILKGIDLSIQPGEVVDGRLVIFVDSTFN